VEDKNVRTALEKKKTAMGWGHLGRHGSDSAGDSEAGPSTSATEPRRFPLAAQPEMMRAAEKDDQYASFVYEACRDAFRHLFGLSLSLSLSLSSNYIKFPIPNEVSINRILLLLL